MFEMSTLVKIGWSLTEAVTTRCIVWMMLYLIVNDMMMHDVCHNISASAWKWLHDAFNQHTGLEWSCNQVQWWNVAMATSILVVSRKDGSCHVDIGEEYWRTIWPKALTAMDDGQRSNEGSQHTPWLTASFTMQCQKCWIIVIVDNVWTQRQESKDRFQASIKRGYIKAIANEPPPTNQADLSWYMTMCIQHKMKMIIVGSKKGVHITIWNDHVEE